MFDPRSLDTHPAAEPAPLVRREELGAWRRWHAEALDTPAPPQEPQPNGTNDQAAAELAARQLAAWREEARAEGHAQGRLDGHAEGLAAGHAEGQAAGREAGYAQGLAEGRAVAAANAAALKTALDATTRALASLHAGVGSALTHLAVEIARQVLRTELRQQPEAIITVVQEILHHEPAAQGVVQLHLHPDDAALAADHLGETLAEHQWRIVPDPAVTRGGCRLETALGDIDATLQSRWRNAVAALGANEEWSNI